MIKYSIRGENLEVTEAIRDYVVSKLEKIEKYFQQFLNTIYSCSCSIDIIYK
ncbi:ribosomal subunit interface protein [Streptococcus pneumoniae]|nr:ribosomal subunit interface protein [Streptococcus pneumoniae]